MEVKKEVEREGGRKDGQIDGDSKSLESNKGMGKLLSWTAKMNDSSAPRV